LIVCRSHENFIQVCIEHEYIADVETLYARLGERDYEAVMSYLADDIVWIVVTIRRWRTAALITG